jgi:hypothetical protein
MITEPGSMEGTGGIPFRANDGRDIWPDKQKVRKPFSGSMSVPQMAASPSIQNKQAPDARPGSATV